MTNKQILKLTLEEYGYDLNKLTYPSNGLIMAISEAMKRARIDQCESKQALDNDIEQFFIDEHEQAMKRGGGEYAFGYYEGLKDGYNKAKNN